MNDANQVRSMNRLVWRFQCVEFLRGAQKRPCKEQSIHRIESYPRGFFVRDAYRCCRIADPKPNVVQIVLVEFDLGSTLIEDCFRKKLQLQKRAGNEEAIGI